MVKLSEFIPTTTQRILRSIFRENKQVLVTHHAVRRFLDWRRRGDTEITRTCDAEEFLTQLARKGKRTRRLPDGAYEVEFQGLYAVVKFKSKENRFVVVTFNRDEEWRRWWRKQRKRERMSAKTLAAL